MTTFHGIVNAGRTLSYYSRLQEITANNLANVNTEGFKADRMSARLLPDTTNPIPVEHTDLSQGALRVTGRPLDLAMEGNGFLVVQTAQGDRLIRGGSFKLDGSGTLTDAEGNPVLGKGGPIVLTGTEIKIREDGTVLDDDREAGQLITVDPERPDELMKEAAGRFVSSVPIDQMPASTAVLRQGQLEDANFNALGAMVSLVEIQRAYAANVTAVRTMDGVLSSITNDIGRV